MKRRERKVVGAYLRGVADLLELRDWTFHLEREPAKPGCDGFVSITYGRKLATIWLDEDFRQFDAERQRHTIVHELVHCHLEASTNMVRNDLQDHLGKAADALFWESYRRQAEYAVDALASALAKHMPLIDWPTS